MNYLIFLFLIIPSESFASLLSKKKKKMKAQAIISLTFKSQRNRSLIFKRELEKLALVEWKALVGWDNKPILRMEVQKSALSLLYFELLNHRAG
jgi:hypothetical protein